MNRMLRGVSLCFLFLCFSPLCAEPPSSSFCLSQGELFPGFGWSVGNGRSYREGYETVALFGQWKGYGSPFFDVEWHYLWEDKCAANIGVGYRWPFGACCSVVGANLFYDYRHVAEGNVHQLGLGVELLSGLWDIVVNGYMPIRRRLFVDETVFVYPGDFVADRSIYESGMWGMDVCVGTSFCFGRCVELYTALGPYFYGSLCCRNLVGGMGRVGVSFNDYFSIEVCTTYDRFFGAKMQGEFYLMIPFSRILSPCACVCPPMGVQRNRIIVVEKTCHWKTNF